MNHLIVKLFHSYLFIEINPTRCCLHFFSYIFFTVRLILKVHITIFDEFLSKFAHTLSIFWFGTVTHYARSSLGFHYLLLRNQLRLRVNLWRVEISCPWLVSVGKNPTLKQISSTFLCLEFLIGISFEIYSANFLFLSESYLSFDLSYFRNIQKR